MTTQDFFNYLLQFGELNQNQIDLINNNLTLKNYKKGDFFLKADQISNEIGFVLNGVYRVCYYSKEGNEITRYFIEEGKFIADLNSFNTSIPSSEYIESITDSQVLILTKQAMHTLSSTIMVWNEIIAKIAAKVLSEKVAKVSLMLPQDAIKRYEFFLENFPGLANRIPLQYIASYIGVTKYSLSRLRRSNQIKTNNKQN